MDKIVLMLLVYFMASPLVLASPLGKYDLVKWLSGFSAGTSVLTIAGTAPYIAEKARERNRQSQNCCLTKLN